MKIIELVPTVEYYALFQKGLSEPYKYRINEQGVFESKGVSGWFYSCRSYNELMSATFEPCEWMPKINESYFSPDYIAHHGFLAYESIWNNTQRDKQSKQNVGIYRTAEEAHAKSLEIGWTLLK